MCCTESIILTGECRQAINQSINQSKDTPERPMEKRKKKKNSRAKAAVDDVVGLEEDEAVEHLSRVRNELTQRDGLWVKGKE